MIMKPGQIVAKAADYFGYELSRKKKDRDRYVDMEPDFFKILSECKGHTMTSVERMYSLYKSVEYVTKNSIPGDFVECGVWKGGSAMVILLTLMKHNIKDRKLYLYDTYEGMPKPGKEDINFLGASAIDRWNEKTKKGKLKWADVGLNEVKDYLKLSGYPMNKLIFVKGMVENTIPETVPEKISVLRLDTDWYDSTKHELENLYPLLSKGGILIIDDYGHYKGSRKATDDYMEKNKIPFFLSRVDYTCRIGVKPN